MGVHSASSFCSLCLGNTLCLYCGVIFENIKTFPRQFPNDFPQCENCLLQKYMHEEVLCTNRLKYYFESYYRMQDRPQPEKSPTETHSPTSACNCENCQSKFTGLQLLANVVENIQKNPKSEEKKKIESIDTCQPSTSQTNQEKSLKSPKMMSCEHCAKVFTHRGDLNKHLRSHTGEQPYECPVCQRKFTHTSNLARHIRVHSGDKPFHCEKCNRNFSRKDKLVMHQKTQLCKKASQRLQGDT